MNIGVVFKNLVSYSFSTEVDFSCFEFASTTSFLESDILILDLKTVLYEFKGGRTDDYPDFPFPYSTIETSDFNRSRTRRIEEIEEFLELGKTIVTFTTPPVNIVLNNNGKSQHYDIRGILPCFPETRLASGNQIEYLGNPIFKDLWTKFSDKLSYEATYKNQFGYPLFKVKGTDNFVGSYIPHKNGNIIFLPQIKISSIQDAVELTAILRSIDRELNKKIEQSEALPSWSTNFKLPNEVDKINELTKHEARLSEVLQKIEKTKASLKEIDELKYLFTSTGSVLEQKVGKVFAMLGFEVAEGVPGRDDLILKYKDRVAVVEVKGVTKSAAEKHAAQLEKWVSEYIGIKEDIPKGILVVNAYKDTPLHERTEKAFPAQMLDYCKRRNHCLLTGLDLLAILFYTQNNPNKKEEIIDDIFNTCGVFEKLNWEEFIQQENSVLSQ